MVDRTIHKYHLDGGGGGGWIMNREKLKFIAYLICMYVDNAIS